METNLIVMVATVRTLIGLGLDDRTIAGAVGSLMGATVAAPAGNGGKRAATVVAPVVAPRDGAVTYRAVVSIDRLNRMGKLTPQQRRVAEYVIANPGMTSKQIAVATGIGEKAVQSPIYQLRATSPVVLKSSRD